MICSSWCCSGCLFRICKSTPKFVFFIVYSPSFWMEGWISAASQEQQYSIRNLVKYLIICGWVKYIGKTNWINLILKIIIINFVCNKAKDNHFGNHQILKWFTRFWLFLTIILLAKHYKSIHYKTAGVIKQGVLSQFLSASSSWRESSRLNGSQSVSLARRQ